MSIFKNFSLSLISLCVAVQFDLTASTMSAPTEDYIQEIIDAEADWDANQLSEMYTHVDIAARDCRDIGMHVAARDSRDIGFAAKSSKDIGLRHAAKSSRDIGAHFAAKSSKDIGATA